MPIGGGTLTIPPGAVTLTLQADFSGTAFGGSPTWTDITAYWMSSSTDPGGGPVTIPWGRQDQSSVVESSTTSFTFNNADGRFTPGRSTLVTGGANPYYPQVRRHVRMRLTATDGTTTVVLVDGLVDAWVVTPQTGGPTLATAELTDLFGRVSASTALRSLMQETILLDAPHVYLPLTDEAGATSATVFTAPVETGATGVVKQSKYGGGSYAFSGGAGPAAEGTQALTLSPVSATQGYVIDVQLPTPLALTTGIFLTVRVNWTGTATSGELVALRNPSTGNMLSIRLDGTGKAVAWVGTTATTAVSAAAVNDGHPHDLILRWFNTGGVGSVNLYVDGGAAVTASSTTFFTNFTEFQVGGQVDSAGVANLTAGTYSHAAAFTRIVNVTDQYHAGADGFAGESTTTRWARLLTYRPNQGGTTTGTLGAVGSRDLTGMSLGDALTDTATAEGGVIETHRGSLTLIGRSGTRNPTTTLTLDASLGQVDLPTTWRDDTQGFVNDVTVTRANGAAQRVTSAASIAADGTSQTSVDANVNSDRDAADMAGWMVAVGTQDELTSPTLTVDLNARKDSALTLAVCALRTFDIVTLTNLPSSAPASTLSLEAQGGQLTIGADTFTAQVNTTAKPPQILRADATADAYTLLDGVNVIGW